ncbi:MAG: RNA-guided pseudouridylation complex pseudouridine synthase subunit Cbf5 [Candidatus Bathyarchaeia archaeon]|nr:RNA-guided pseudouridylation complex pseudouridine synthase subunit Cbf5 [Candidatus Bathyarchaeota archaeon]
MDLELIPPWLEERTLTVREEDETDPRFGCDPWNRPLRDHIRFGLINLDKPPGPSSHEVVAWVKRILKVGKAGHGGTLDPKVTGVLPVALEDATKAVKAFLLSGKEYVCLMQLHSEASMEALAKIMGEFTGEIYQLPPVKSSVKRALRRRAIYYIRLLDVEDRLVLFRVACQAGTYIRKLCYDMGEALGVGAHMRELRRIRSGPFHVDDGLSLMEDVANAQHEYEEYGDEEALRRIIRPVEEAFKHIPKIYVRDTAVDALCHGALLAVPGVVKFDSKIRRSSDVAIFTLKGEVVGMGRALMSAKEMLEARRGVAAEIHRVIMPPNTYPRSWRGKAG